MLNSKYLSAKKIFQTLFLQRGNDIQLLKAYNQVFSSVVPFDFNGESFIPPSTKKLCTWAPVFIFLCYQLWRYFRLIGHLASIHDFENTFVIIFWCNAYFSTFVHLYNGYYNSNHLCFAYNTWKILKKDETTLFAVLLRSLLPIGTTTTITIGILHLCDSKLPYFIVNEISNEPSTLAYILCLVYELMSGFIVFGCHMVSDSLLLRLCNEVSVKLDKLLNANNGDMPDTSTGGIEDKSTQKIVGNGISDEELKTYRTLQLFEQSMNHACASEFFIIKLTSYFQISYLAVMVITGIANFNVLNVMYGIPQVLPLLLRIRGFLTEMTVMNNKSVALLEQWKTKPDDTGFSSISEAERKIYVQKFVASCRPVQFNAGAVYAIKGNTLLTFGSGVLSNTAGILIALKDKKLL